MEYRNAKYIANGWIDCEIKHPTRGWLPFTANPDDKSAQFDVAEMFKRMAADKATLAYVAPKPDIDALRASAAVPRADFCNGLADIGLLKDEDAVSAARGEWPAAMEAFLSFLDSRQRRDVQIGWASCATVQRLHPFVFSLASWLGMTDEQVDDLFGL